MNRTWGYCGKLVLYTAVLGSMLTACTSPDSPAREVYRAPFPALRSGETLVVIGVRQEVKELNPANREALRHPWIGFGLSSLLTQSLFNTGNFRLLEQGVHQREILNDLVQTSWTERRAEYAEQELSRVAAQLSVPLLAYGSVSYMGVDTRTFGLGPVVSQVQTLRLRVNVCLYEATTRAILCRAGEGRDKQESTGVIYVPRDNRLSFEESKVGRATAQAVAQAVQQLMGSLHFSP